MAKLMAAEWVHIEPTLKDRIIGKAQEGRWHKDWAECVAKKYKIGPLAKRPETAMFDPMAEPVWTLAMVVAWIVWRTPDDVRENWDAYRIGCLDWRCHPRRVSRDGGRTWEQVGIYWDLKTRCAASLSNMAVGEETRRLMTIDDAWNALRNRAIEGMLTVWAIQDDTNRPIAIQAREWAYLDHAGSGILGDELRADRNSRDAQYRDMTFMRDEICGLWPDDGLQVSSSLCVDVPSSAPQPTTSTVKGRIALAVEACWPAGQIAGLKKTRNSTIQDWCLKEGWAKPSERSIRSYFNKP